MINIVYAHDNKLNNLLQKSKDSFLKYNPNVQFFEITEDKQGLLKDFTQELCGFGHVSTACFLRLLIPRMFPNLDRVLYVDCDILCLSDISELYNADFENNYLIGCRGFNYSDNQAKQLGIPHYINSGMLMFNIPLMNKENYFEQILNNWKGSLGKQKPFSADETIINWCFHNKIKLVNEKWNYCYNRKYSDRAVKEQDIKILHFVGVDKLAMLRYKYD
jgi:lipopolysaccharide biosynthesis glycosyltransferase